MAWSLPGLAIWTSVRRCKPPSLTSSGVPTSAGESGFLKERVPCRKLRLARRTDAQMPTLRAHAIVRHLAGPFVWPQLRCPRHARINAYSFPLSQKGGRMTEAYSAGLLIDMGMRGANGAGRRSRSCVSGPVGANHMRCLSTPAHNSRLRLNSAKEGLRTSDPLTQYARRACAIRIPPSASIRVHLRLIKSQSRWVSASLCLRELCERRAYWNSVRAMTSSWSCSGSAVK